MLKRILSDAFGIFNLSLTQYCHEPNQNRRFGVPGGRTDEKYDADPT
jgi:hypothetical protein